MNNAPARSGAIFLVLVVGFVFGLAFRNRHPRDLFSPTTAAAQTVDGSSPAAGAVPVASVAPAADGQTLAASITHTDAKGRHLAPHDTFYLLDYVSAKTDKGVDGFEPGQEVHLVAVHRPTQTLLVSDGRAQVEVSPSKLTNDMDIAALVRQKDQANQTQIAEYIQREEAAYRKAQKEAADATAKDLERHNQEQVAQSRIGESTQVDMPAQPTDTSTASGSASLGYYGNGGSGYGSPYSYFSGGGDNTVVVLPAAPAKAPAAPPAAPAAPAAKVGVPGNSGVGRPR